MRWLWDELHDLIAKIVIVEDEVNVVEWLPEKQKTFSVKSSHKVLNFSSAFAPISEERRIAVKFMWRIPAPPNVLLFRWRLNLDRLPTID